MYDRADVCVVGAGIAGLNAAAVAAQYLSPQQKIVLIDRRQQPGGMWVDIYPFVRLHQPHPMFTVANIPWAWTKERSYLASRVEVLDHFAHCLDVIRERVQLVEYYGWTVESTRETATETITTARAEDGRRLVVTAPRLIKASGFDVAPNPAFPVTSDRIRSVSPDVVDIRGPEIATSAAPIWIVGSGKTAMDTALAAITMYPGREVGIVAGSGTYFIDRDKRYPTGARRWRSRTTVNRLLGEIALRFDGTNEDDVRDWFRSTYALEPTGPAKHFLVGLLSEAESATISGGLRFVDHEHLVDAVDVADGVELRYRSGASRRVPAGSWLVNCTGYLLKQDCVHEPYVSAGGRTLSINNRSATIGFTSFAGYFLTHLLFLGKLSEVPLYELDGHALQRAAPDALPWIVFAAGQYNLSLIFDAVPRTVFRDCGLDFDRWYPLPHRLLAGIHFMRTHHRDREHHRRTLDTVRERFGVRCGPLATPVLR